MSTVTRVDGFNNVNEQRKRFVRLYASEAIAKGDAVAIDSATSTYGLGNHVLKAASGEAGNKAVLGVAVEAITSGELGKIQVSGICTVAKILDTSDALGNVLCASGTDGSLTLMDVSSTHFDLPAAILLAEGTANEPFSVGKFTLPNESMD